MSPNQRNIRNASIYKNGSGQSKVYGRVLPSEWPDGGHDVEVIPWNSGWNSQRQGYEGKYDPITGKVLAPPYNGTGPAFDPTPLVFPVAKLPAPGEAPTYLSSRGRFYSTTELGRLYDPVMFLPTFDPASGMDSDLLRGAGDPVDGKGKMSKPGASWPLVQVNNAKSPYFGGGNTLRIGRPEHPNFDQPSKHAPADMPGNHAARLLDLFHAGDPLDDAKDRDGPVVRIDGHVNINTASLDALRAMSAGYLQMDPKLSKRTSDVYDARMAPPVQPLATLSAPTSSREADKIADAIINGRPYATPSELACATDTDGKQVFGNTDLYPDKDKIQWSDTAAEEIFGRIYEASTVRSRNFRVWVVGQAIAPTQASNPSPRSLRSSQNLYRFRRSRRAKDRRLHRSFQIPSIHSP